MAIRLVCACLNEGGGVVVILEMRWLVGNISESKIVGFRGIVPRPLRNSLRLGIASYPTHLTQPHAQIWAT